MAVSHSGGIGHTVSNEGLSNPSVVRKRSDSLCGNEGVWFGLCYDEQKGLIGCESTRAERRS